MPRPLAGLKILTFPKESASCPPSRAGFSDGKSLHFYCEGWQNG